jgi:hypothetical protein
MTDFFRLSRTLSLFASARCAIDSSVPHTLCSCSREPSVSSLRQKSL